MSRTEYVETGGGRIAFEVTGRGPLVVLSPGMADTRNTYRFLGPLIVAAGYRVASVDLRGHGESSTDWDAYTRSDTAHDLLAVVRALGGPATIVGQSFSGGAATIAAATQPELVNAIVEIGPFTRPPTFSAAAFLRNDHNYRRGAVELGLFALTGRVENWAKYLDLALSRTQAGGLGQLVGRAARESARTRPHSGGSTHDAVETRGRCGATDERPLPRAGGDG